jgi:DMSO/TMAO reductase YedYZ molybdopterin-dependent catalytic subunit
MVGYLDLMVFEHFLLLGETLPRDHGYPLRLLAPGHAGCRNVKWVSTIIVSDEASELDSGSRLDRLNDQHLKILIFTH